MKIHLLTWSSTNKHCQIWYLFEDGRLFHAVKDGRLSDELHLAEMVALMGPPPKAFVERSEECRKYWDVDGMFPSLSDPYLHDRTWTC
jgi:hypothetical protein